MVISKKTISRFILIILILEPSILLGFAPAVQAIRQIVTAVATASPQVIEFVKNSANAIVVMATNPPQPPPHVQDELKKIMLNSKMVAAKAQAAGLKPFPKFTTIAAKMPAALKAHAKAQVALSANGSHHQLMAAVKEKITMMKVSPAKIPIAAAAKGAQHFAHNITKIPTVQIAVTQSMAKPTITMVPIQSAAAPSAIIKQTAANIPSQFTKNTIVAAATHQTGNNPKAVISAAHSLPAQQTVHRARTVATPPASLPAQQTGSRVQVTMGNGDLIVSDLQAINNNHATFVAHENQRIFNNPHLKSIFASQKITVSENLKQACNLSCTPEIIKAQLTLLNNSYVHQAENFDLQYATKKMIGEITDSNGEFIGCLSQKTADKLSHFASMKVSVGDFFVNCWTSIKKAVGFTPDISQKFVENSYNTNLYNFCENILKKQIDESEHFLTLIKPNHPYDYCPKCKIHAIMHKELFALKFNEHLIPRTFEQDPLWPSLKKVLDQLRPQKNFDWIHQICSTKSQLESRHNIVQFLLQKLNRQIDQPAPAILYDIAPTYENPAATVEYLAKLSSDHPEARIREAHSIIFGTQTLPKIYDYPHLERLKDVIIFSKDLFLEKFNDLRAIYLRLTTLQPETEQGTAGMLQGFIYAQKALESDTHRALYKNLAKEIL